MDLATYFRFVLALAFVVGLIMALAWVVRRYGLAGRLLPRAGQVRRVQVVEVTPLDGRHKLVLVQRDEVEHLILVGTGDPLLIERGIAARDGDSTPGDFARTLEAERRT